MKAGLLLTLMSYILTDTTVQALNVQFEQSEYVFSEFDVGTGYGSSVCVTLFNQTLEREVMFLIQDFNGTAQAQRDYSPIVIFGSLQPLQGSFCFNVTQYLIDDSVVENTEVFTINFIDDTAYSINTVVYITDNDGAIFKLINTVNDGFAADIFSITESNINTTFPVTVELVGGGEVNGSQSGLGRDAVIFVTAEEGVAGSTDFVPVSNLSLTFPVGSVNGDRVTGNIQILGDMLPENAELFEFFVATVNPMDRLEGPTRATVIIQNDDITPNCGQPPSPGVNGLVTYNSTLLGANADYICNNGYQLSPPGMEQRFCLLSGKWSGVDLTCEVVDCGPLGDPVSGLVLVNGTVFGSQALYRCDVGHQLSANDSRTCQSDGFWSGFEPTCQAVDCSVLPTLPNGLIAINDTTFNSTASYSCDTGYELVGNTTRICQANGNWSGSQPSCLVVDCGQLVAPDDGQVTVSNTSYLSESNYTCNDGYSISGDIHVTRVCLANGTWSGDPPICIDINECLDGPCHVYGRCTNTLGSYSCSCMEGFYGNGSFCKAVDCGGLPPLPNGLMVINDTTFNSTASYSCDTGYELVGNTTRICQANGNWSGDQPSCLVVDCGPLGDPVSGLVQVNGTVFGSQAVYRCDVGHQLSGSDSRTCQSDGLWSGIEPTCQAIDCGQLPNITGGTVQLRNGSKLSSSAVYNCNDGYVVQGGDVERTCLSNGRWSGIALVCIFGGAPDLGGMSNVMQTSIDIVVVAISVSVAGFSIAVIITTVVILLGVRRARLRAKDTVYSSNYHETTIANDASRSFNQELAPYQECERPIYATLHQLPS